MSNESGIKPLGHRVLVRAISTERLTTGGIVIPEPVAERNDKAQIKAIVVDYGPTAWMAEGLGGSPWASIGDTVIIGKFAGVLLKGKDGVQYRVVNDDELQARVSE